MSRGRHQCVPSDGDGAHYRRDIELDWVIRVARYELGARRLAQGAWRLRIVKRSDAVGREVFQKRWIVETNVLRGSAAMKFTNLPVPDKRLFNSDM